MSTTIKVPYERVKEHVTIKFSNTTYTNCFIISDVFMDFWNYVIDLYYENGSCNKDMLIPVKFDDNIKDVSSGTSCKEYSFVFEFPDDYPEEELFYFKLKYS